MKVVFRIVGRSKTDPGCIESLSSVWHASVTDALQEASGLPGAFVGCYEVGEDALLRWLFDLDKQGQLDPDNDGSRG